MRKGRRLKAKLIRDGVIFLVLAAVFGGGAFVVSGLTQASREENTRKENSIRQMTAQIASLNQNYSKARELFDTFSQVRKALDNQDYALDPKQLEEQLRQLKDKYRLISLQTEFEVLQPLDVIDEMKNNNSLSANYTLVKINLIALSDTHIYSFIDELEANLNGIVRQKSLEVSEEKEFNDNVFFGISQGKMPAMVSGSYSFYWIEIKDKG